MRTLSRSHRLCIKHLEVLWKSPKLVSRQNMRLILNGHGQLFSRTEPHETWLIIKRVALLKNLIWFSVESTSTIFITEEQTRNHQSKKQGKVGFFSLQGAVCPCLVYKVMRRVFIFFRLAALIENQQINVNLEWKHSVHVCLSEFTFSWVMSLVECIMKMVLKGQFYVKIQNNLTEKFNWPMETKFCSRKRFLGSTKHEPYSGWPISPWTVKSEIK